MIKKMKCKNCLETKTEKGYRNCFSCESKGCNKCIEIVCCDCCVIMCKNCRNNDEINCGCYGQCSSCRTNVDRGNDGWPCYKCKKWYCSNCKNNSKCKECNPDED